MGNYQVKVLPLYLTMLSLLLLLDVMSGGGSFGLILILVVFSSLLTLSFNDNLRLFVFLIPSVYYFSQMSGAGNPLTYFLILLFLKYLLYAHDKDFNIINIVLAVLIVSLELVSLIFNGMSYLGEFLRWSSLFVFAILLMSETSTTRSFSSYVGYFILGYFISSIIGLVAFYFGGLVDDSPNPIRRFSGLSGDPNSYGMYALLVLSFLLLKLENISNIRASLPIWVGVIAVGFLSILTVSRTLLICYIFIMLVYFLLNIRRKKGITIIVMLTVCSVVGGVVGNSYGLFDGYANRFDHSDLSGLTGSRSIIFIEYIKGFLGESFFHILFGAGVVGYMDYYFQSAVDFNSLGYFYEPIGPHNTFIELVVSFGLIGSILFLILLHRCMFNPWLPGRDNIRYRDFLPLVVIFVYCFSLQSLGQYVFYFMLMLVAMSFSEKMKNGTE